MGLNCRVVKDNFDRVVGVLAPNGQKSILFDQALKYLTGKTISSINKNQNSVKEGVSSIFENHPELAKLGTENEYSQYVDSIFPNSKIKDVVYHLTKYDFDKFEKRPNIKRNKTDTTGIHFIDAVEVENYKEVYGKITKFAVLNFINPIASEYDNSLEGNPAIELEYLNEEREENFKSQGYDSGIIQHTSEKEFVAFDEDQIHVLGSKDDIKNFEEYQNNSKNKTTEQDIDGALNIFASAYTQGFEDFFTDEFFNKTNQTDINGEPVLEDVLTYLKSTENHILNEIDKIDFEDFKNQFGDLDYQTLENKIYDAFLDENGNFTLDEQKLRKSELYDSQEIDNILNNSDLQEKIKSSVLALNKEDFINNQEDNFLKITKGDEIGSFGKLKLYDSVTLLDSILKSTVDSISEDEFDTMLNQSVSEDVYNAIIDNEEMYNTLKSMALNLKKIPVKVFENGTIKDSLDRDIFNELKETLIVTNINSEAVSNINMLTQLDYDIMLENMDQVVELTKTIEKGLISSNIDIIGLSDKILTENIEKVQSFLRALGDLTSIVNNGFVNDEVLNAFSDVYNDFFNIKNRTDLVDIESYDYDVVRIIDPISKLDAYANGYLKINGNDYIQVINSSYNDLITSLLDSYEVGENVLEGVIPNNLKSEVSYRNYLDSIVNSKINSFGEQINPTDLDAFKSIVLLEYLNNVDNEQSNKIGNYSEVKQDLQSKDLVYLTFDFLSDLNNISLISKFNESPLYDKIFKYLEYKNGQVNIKSNEDLITNRIQNLLPDNNPVLKTLKDYFKPEEIIDPSDNYLGKSEREYYFNNSSELPFINEGYSYFENQLVSDLVLPDFIKTKEGVFERIDSLEGMSLFSKLVEDGDTVKIDSLNKQFEGGVTMENMLKFNNKYSQNQKENILKDINNCN